MIQNLCNLVDENNLDTFYKIMIVEASALPKFDELTSKSEILGIINSLPESFQAMVVPLMPEKLSINSGPRNNNENTGFSHGISLPLVPQDENIKALLETYNNKEVVAFLIRISHSYLYGTQAQPLIFSYSELHAQNKTGLKGYTLSLRGETYGSAIYFAGKEAEFPVVNRGLAFQLASTL